jgi:hypothetical protein
LKIIFWHGEIYLSFHNSSFAFFCGGRKNSKKKKKSKFGDFLIEKMRIIEIEDSLKLFSPHFGEILAQKKKEKEKE